MEAAIRTVYVIMTGRELLFEKLHVVPIVVLDQIEDATLKFENVLPEYKMFEGFEVKVAVTSGLVGAKILTDQIVTGTSPYHFIEVMGCPSGCVCGGGKPRSNVPDRLKAIYTENNSGSCTSTLLDTIYKNYLGKLEGYLSHELLHTHYI